MAGEAEPSAPLPETGAGASPEQSGASPPVAPAVVPAAVEAPAPAAPAVAEPAPAETPTLLETIKTEPEKPAEAPKPEAEKPAAEAKPEEKPADKPADKPVEAKPADGEKPAEAPAEPAKLEPIAYEYALPETIKMDDAFKGEFHTALDAFRADPLKGSQGLIDLHNKAMTNFAEQTLRNQISTFNQTRKDWQTEVMASDDLGGAGHQTSMAAVARMRDLLVPEERRAAFNDFLRITGAGDHPEFLRLLHNAARIYDEAPMPPPGAKPPPNIGKPQGRGLRGMYKTPGRQQ